MNNNESERLTRLETQMSDIKLCMGELKVDVKKIMTNDLPHLQTAIMELKLAFNKRMSKNEKKMAVLVAKVGTGIAIGTSILTYLANRFLP